MSIKRVAAAAVALVFFCGFLALGTWQVQRRAWKLDLISRVEQRVHAAPVAAPGRSEWSGVTAQSAEYRHVRAIGRFLRGRSTRVQALTERGAGYWILTPLEQPDGSIILVNRGFVADDGRAGTDLDAGSHEATTVTGLLRMSEPGGAFLRHNDPVANRWYSRDVPAIARARALHDVAPYFIDADRATTPAPDAPIGGLTVLAFPNNHLVYAITWYTLALMIPVALGVALHAER
jgi:surfeit locus 1 family protein